jgi:hypothetical protein
MGLRVISLVLIIWLLLCFFSFPGSMCALYSCEVKCFGGSFVSMLWGWLHILVLCTGPVSWSCPCDFGYVCGLEVEWHFWFSFFFLIFFLVNKLSL